MKSILKLSKNEEKQILKVLKKRKSISAKEYREIISQSKQKQKRFEKKDFSFFVDITKQKRDVFLITVNGRHYSNNSINSFSKRELFQYKNALRDSFNNAYLIYKEILPKKAECAVLKPTAYNPRSRDQDANTITLKHIQDHLVRLGFAVDDKRKYVSQEKCEEVLSKEWKIEIEVKIS